MIQNAFKKKNELNSWEGTNADSIQNVSGGVEEVRTV
jgi:hypothetical protein